MTFKLTIRERVLLGQYSEDEVEAMSTSEMRSYLRERIRLIKKHVGHPINDSRTWPDYEFVMTETFRKQGDALLPHLVASWDMLTTSLPSVAAFYEIEIAQRRTPVKQQSAARLMRRARLATLKKLLADARWLGRFETCMYGNARFGYPTNVL